MLKKFFLFVLILFSSKSFANFNYANLDSNYQEIIFQCKITQSDKNHIIAKPKKFNRSNNLTRRSNDVFFSKGEPIIIEGYILDKNCVPITNASIQLWQSNAYGLDQKKINPKEFYKNPEKLANYDPQFANNGSTTSDNKGFYRFIVIEPCKKCPKKIDLSVRHKKFKEIEKIISIDTSENENLIRYDKKNHQKAETLEYELINIHGYETICPNDILKLNKKINIKTGDSFAKYIGKFDQKNLYRFDIVLNGKEEYRKY
jgi:protocatechuate 3,4-dioxygenase beta subunit